MESSKFPILQILPPGMMYVENRIKLEWKDKQLDRFCQLTDSDGQSFLQAFETTGDKTLQGRGEEFVSTYPYPESPYRRTDGRMVAS